MPVPNMTNAPSREVNDQLSKLNKSKRYEMTKYQQRQIAESKPFYIYNVSPIHEWPKFQGQLGTVTIRKRATDAEVSEPVIIPGAVARWFDKGLGRKEVFIEDGREIAEDICGCSKEYPAETANNNLINFGVFILEKPIEDLKAEERDQVLEAAYAKLDIKLRQLILEADNFHSGGEKQKLNICDIHRAALTALNEMTDGNEERPWAPIRTSSRKVPCQFCGSANRAGVALCSNCKEVINQEAYDAIKKTQSKKKA